MSWPLVLQTLVALMGATGVTQLIGWARSRKSAQLTKVEAAERVNDMAVEWAAAVQVEAAAARAEAKAAREEAKAARVEMEALYLSLQKYRREFDAMARRLAVQHRAIMSPDMTIDQLRLLAAQDYTPENGKP